MQQVSDISGIRVNFLKSRSIQQLYDCSVAERMSWAASRRTTRVEDEAYCLLGLFGVSMPLIYGEGRMAFMRLQEEIIKRSTDQSIFAWNADPSQERAPSILSPSPSYFTRTIDHDPSSECNGLAPYTITNRGLELRANLSKVHEIDSAGFVREMIERLHGEIYVLELTCMDSVSRRTVQLALRKTGSNQFHRICLPNEEHTLERASKYQGGERLIYLQMNYRDAIMEHDLRALFA